MHDRIKDMDAEGRDIDFLIPGTWATAASGLPDVTLAEALYRSYHNYIAAYCQPYLSRLRSMVLVPGGDVEWAVKEVNRLKNEPWVAAVGPLLPEGKPIDHPDLAPLWDVMNDAHLPIFFHSFFYEPPYFPGYRDIWGNAVVHVLVHDADRRRHAMMARRAGDTAFERAFPACHHLRLFRRFAWKAVEGIGSDGQEARGRLAPIASGAHEGLELGDTRTSAGIEIFDERVVARVHMGVDVDDLKAVPHTLPSLAPP